MAYSAYQNRPLMVHTSIHLKFLKSPLTLCLPFRPQDTQSSAETNYITNVQTFQRKTIGRERQRQSAESLRTLPHSSKPETRTQKSKINPILFVQQYHRQDDSGRRRKGIPCTLQPSIALINTLKLYTYMCVRPKVCVLTTRRIVKLLRIILSS